MQLSTERLLLRRMTDSDLPALRQMLCDPKVMYAYGGPFPEQDVRAWLDRQYERYGQGEDFGLLAMVLKETGQMIGQCGLTMQPCPKELVLEVGYLLCYAFWHQGYATEAAKGCLDHAFGDMGAQRVHAIIRDTNTASQQVAQRLGMQVVGRFDKCYRGAVMPHLVYCISRS